RARVLRSTARRLESRRVDVAEALEQAALAELEARKPDRVLATNVEFWSAVVLDFAEVPPDLFTSMFTCARTAGWSAHILERKPEDDASGVPGRGRAHLRDGLELWAGAASCLVREPARQSRSLRSDRDAPHGRTGPRCHR